MAGMMDMLGAILQQGMAPSAGSRMTHALGGGRAGGSLNDIMGSIGQILGSGSSTQAPQAGQTQHAASGGLGGILGEVLGSLGNNRTALDGLGALAGALLGGGKGSSRSAVGGGGLAMLASLAFSALKNVGQTPAQTPRALLEPQTAQDEQALEEDAEIIVKAMINAAKADGRIDETEVRKIIGRLEKDGLTAEEKDFFLAEAGKPLDLDAVVASAEGRPDMAAQLYAASLLAIEVDTPAEQQYMQELAARLGLHPQVVSHIEATLGMRAM